jgi:uncharacterized protein (DUF3820 family)
MILRFGQYKGQRVESVPDDYLMLLAEDFYERSTFRVYFKVRMEARDLLRLRGYRKIGSRWEHAET